MEAHTIYTQYLKCSLNYYWTQLKSNKNIWLFRLFEWFHFLPLKKRSHTKQVTLVILPKFIICALCMVVIFAGWTDRSWTHYARKIKQKNVDFCWNAILKMIFNHFFLLLLYIIWTFNFLNEAIISMYQTKRDR